MQPKNLKTRTWAARVVTYLLYHKCNAEPVNVYTSLLTTYGAVLWQIANIYLYCTVNLQDSAPNNNYYERRKNQTSESTEKNSELQMRFKLWQPSRVHDRTLYHWATGGSRVQNFIIIHQHERTMCIRYLFKISCTLHLTTNRPFPRCFKPPFQSEAKCKAMDMKIIFYSRTNKTTSTREVFHIASFWKWEFLELGNGIAIRVKKSEQFVSVSKF